jgi:hypothetical protein
VDVVDVDAVDKELGGNMLKAVDVPLNVATKSAVLIEDNFIVDGRFKYLLIVYGYEQIVMRYRYYILYTEPSRMMIDNPMLGSRFSTSMLYCFLLIVAYC